MDDTAIVEWTFRGAVAGLFVLGARLWNNMVGDVEDLKLKQDADSRELNAFKLHVADTYPNQMTMARLHDRLDATATKEDVAELRAILLKKA